MADKHIKEYISESNWYSSYFLEGISKNNLWDKGLIRYGNAETVSLLDTLNLGIIPSKLTIGNSYFKDKESNIGDTSDDLAVPSEAYGSELTIKTQYRNMWWETRRIQQDLMNSTDPKGLIRRVVATAWLKEFNKIAAATLKGLKTETKITVDKKTEAFSKKHILEVRQLRGQYGYEEPLGRLVMNSKTLNAILNAQTAKDAEQVIYQLHGSTQVSPNSYSTQVSQQLPMYAYEGVTPIILEDLLPDGQISIVKDGSFIFAMKDIKDSLSYTNQPLLGMGSGAEMFGSTMLYILHPDRFSFVGEKGTNFNKAQGVTMAELAAGNQYKLVGDVKDSPITNLFVKIT